MSIDRSSSAGGSSSTTIATFCMASRKRRGIARNASATWFSKCFRSTRAWRDDEPEVVAVVAHDALIAQRLRFADASAMQNERVGRPRPPLLRQRLAELILNRHRIVAFRDANSIRHAKHMTIDRQPRHTERVPEDDVRGFAADAGQL